MSLLIQTDQGAREINSGERDSIRSALGLSDGSAGPGVFPFQAETLTAMAAVAPVVGASIPDRRQRTIDRMVERLKEVGAWSRLTALYLDGWETADGTSINLRNPGTYDKVLAGTATHTALNGFTYPSASGANFHNTGIAPSSLSQNDVSMGVLMQGFVQGSGDSYLMGAVDTGTSNGLSLRYNSGSGAESRIFVSAFGQEVQSTDLKAREGMVAVNRKNGTEVELWHNSRKLDTLASASVAPSGITNPITVGKINGRSTNCRNRIRASFVGQSMTDDQMKVLFAAIWDCLDKMRQGEILFYPKATSPETITGYDAVFYGTTLGSIGAAVQAARSGRKVCVIGGWRDGYQIGGMTLNGLGWIDWDNYSQLTGIMRTWVRRGRVLQGTSTELPGPNQPFTVVPRLFLQVIREQLDASRGGFDIPIFLTGGVASVTKAGDGRVTSITTMDGRTFTGFSYWGDGSYEADVWAKAGFLYATGREAAGNGRESINGFQPSESMGVSPYNTPGVPASGLLPGVFPITKAVGDADEGTQAHNFRMTWTTDIGRRLPLAPEPPPGYNAANYEILARTMVRASPTPITTLGQLFALDTLENTNILDVNNKGFFSTDYVLPGDKAGDYLRAPTYAAREVIWQEHRSYQLGLLHWLLYSGDPRIPSGLITSLQGYGWDPYHYLDTHTVAEINYMQQEYIREALRIRRLDGWVYNANDSGMADGTTPRTPYGAGNPWQPEGTIFTIADNSYACDSHAIRYLANTSDPDPANHFIQSEGGFFFVTGGTNKLSPMPLAIATDSQQCPNGAVMFAFCATHAANGSLRMEPPMTNVGQSIGALIHLAIEAGGIPLEQVNRDAFRALLQSEPNDPVPASLRLVN